jgi:hypothetical protein
LDSAFQLQSPQCRADDEIALPSVAFHQAMEGYLQQRRVGIECRAPEASAPCSVELDAAAGQAISACGGDARKTVTGP